LDVEEFRTLPKWLGIAARYLFVHNETRQKAFDLGLRDVGLAENMDHLGEDSVADVLVELLDPALDVLLRWAQNLPRPVVEAVASIAGGYGNDYIAVIMPARDSRSVSSIS
jgi:hypothetical protein